MYHTVSVNSFVVRYLGPNQCLTMMHRSAKFMAKRKKGSSSKVHYVLNIILHFLRYKSSKTV